MLFALARDEPTHGGEAAMNGAPAFGLAEMSLWCPDPPGCVATRVEREKQVSFGFAQDRIFGFAQDRIFDYATLRSR